MYSLVVRSLSLLTASLVVEHLAQQEDHFKLLVLSVRRELIQLALGQGHPVDLRALLLQLLVSFAHDLVLLLALVLQKILQVLPEVHHLAWPEVLNLVREVRKDVVVAKGILALLVHDQRAADAVAPA